MRNVAEKAGWHLDTECLVCSDKKFGLCPLGKGESLMGYTSLLINKEALDQVCSFRNVIVLAA